MHKVDSLVLPQGCKLISLPNVVDERGMLAYGQCMKEIPFEIKRVFWTYGITDGSARGDHAHRTCSMVLFPLGGSFRILLDDGDVKVTLLMDKPNVGILIPPGIWSIQSDFTQHASCVCLASDFYDADDYIHSYEEFLKFIGK